MASLRWAVGVWLLGLMSCAPPFEEAVSNRDLLLAEEPPVLWRAWVNHAPVQAAVVGARDAAPILFVHGSPGGWDANAHLLRRPELREGHLLISYDRLGYGGSGGQTEPSLRRQCDAITGLLDALGVRRPVILVGHSMGGPIIARFAMDHPDRTAGLVFIAASVDPDLEAWRWYNRAASWRLAYRILPQPLLTSNEEIRPLRGELEEMLPRWAEIQAPSAIIHGTEDGLVPIANVDFLEARLEGRSTREWIVPGETHGILWTRAYLVEQAVAWIEGLEQGG